MRIAIACIASIAVACSQTPSSVNPAAGQGILVDGNKVSIDPAVVETKADAQSTYATKAEALTTSSALTISSGSVTAEGKGTAGAPAGGVVTVQGASNGTALPVALTGTPSVTLAGSPTVTLSGTSAVTLTGTPAVTLSGTPAVTVSGTPAFTLSGTPAVTLAGTPSVTVSGTPAVTVGNTVTVQGSATGTPLPVQISGTVPVTSAEPGVATTCLLYGFSPGTRHTLSCTGTPPPGANIVLHITDIFHNVNSQMSPGGETIYLSHAASGGCTGGCATDSSLLFLCSLFPGNSWCGTNLRTALRVPATDDLCACSDALTSTVIVSGYWSAP